MTPLKIRAIFFGKPFPMQLNLAKSGIWSRKSRENTFCSQENVEKRGILGGMGASRVQVGPKSGASRRCPRGGADNSKRAYLRAYLWSVEGLYPLEGLERFTGISEGFTGKVERCLYLTEGLLPQGGPVSKKISEFFSGKKLRAPHFPTQGSP